MPLESNFTEQQLFDQLISSLVHTTWVSLGKIKNPITDKIEKDLHIASVNIDMIDMLYKRMDGNLSEAEDKYMSQVLSELKLNYIHEKQVVRMKRLQLIQRKMVLSQILNQKVNLKNRNQLRALRRKSDRFIVE